MDDIVERLQNLLDGPIPWEITRQDARDAINEIERLRTENAGMRRQALQNMIHISEQAGIYQQQRELQRAVYNILASDPTPMATLKDILKE